jgi:hypothetical protein
MAAEASPSSPRPPLRDFAFIDRRSRDVRSFGRNDMARYMTEAKRRGYDDYLDIPEPAHLDILQIVADARLKIELINDKVSPRMNPPLDMLGVCNECQRAARDLVNSQAKPIDDAAMMNNMKLYDMTDEKDNDMELLQLTRI